MRKIYSTILIALFSLTALFAGAVELETKFISYEVSGQVTSTINDDAATISVVMPAGTDLSTLVPDFILSEGANAFIGETAQVTGTTVDFSAGAVEYKVVNETAEQVWTVSAIAAVKVKFNVDMTNAELAEGDVVYVTGDFLGWNEPGTGASILMSDEDGDGVYSAMAYVAENSVIKYKYFKNASWANGDPYNGGTDRTLRIGAGDVEVKPTDVWNQEIVKVTFMVDMTPAELAEGDVVYVTGDFVGWNEPGTGKSILLSDGGEGVWTATAIVAKNAGEIKYKYFKNTGWDNGDPLASGDRALTVAEENITIDPADVWGGEVSVSDDVLGAVKMYPNPFADQLTITNLNEVKEVVVTNLVGQILDVRAVNSSDITINTSELRAGIYMVVVKDNAGNSRAIRVVKQ